MKITGELLKSERTRKNLTVQDVAFSLKLSSKIITSIEAGDTDELPAKTFIRGFVKSYAQYLKMDADQVMRQFQEEMGSTHPHPHPKSPNANGPAAEEASRKNSSEIPKVLSESKSNRSFIYIGVAVILVILIVATNRVVDRYQKESVLNPQDISKVQPLDPNQTQAPVSSAATAATQATPPTSDAVIANSSDATPATVSSSAAPVDSGVTSTTSSLPVETTASADTTAVVSNDTEDGFDASTGKPVELILEAKKDVEIMYARGNTKTFSRLKLSAKQVQVIRSTTGLHLKAEDGGAFHVVVNGVDKGVAGPANKPVKLSF